MSSDKDPANSTRGSLRLAPTAADVEIEKAKLPRQFVNFTFYHARPEWRLLGFVGLVSALVTLFFGALQALRASAVNPDQVLKTGSKQSSAASAIRPWTKTAWTFIHPSALELASV